MPLTETQYSAGVTPPPPPRNGSTISRQELEAWLWEAANILRGPVDPANLRDFIFPLLFLRRLSDTWDEDHEQAIKEYGDAVDDEVAADFHKFDIPDGCHWNDLRRVAENHGIELQKIMQRIEAANQNKLAQIFGNAPWADPDKLPPGRLERLIEHFGQKSLRPSEVSNDLLGHSYEYLLKEFSDESATSAGQFFTPREVIHLLVRILDPQPTDAIYDPACGSAGMLIEAASEVLARGESVAQMRFYGQEINQTSSAIGRINLFIHEVEDSKIRRGDTLRDPTFVDDHGKLDQFDLVVANPPFSLKNWGATDWATDPHRRAVGGVPPKGNGDFAWVQHMVASMASDTGRVGVVMPHGVLFRGGAEAKIRQHLIEADQLEAVIGLAADLFYGTTIPTCLLILRATKAEARANHVLFVDGSKRSERVRGQNTLNSADVDDLYAAYQGKEEFKDIRVRLVPHEEIKANGWDLNIRRYLVTEAAEVIDTTEALAKLTEARRALAEAETTLLKRLKAAGYDST